VVGTREYILRNNSWEAYNHDKSGPIWRNITGEMDTDVIDAADLPADAPR
jgi:hypothetical protein